MRKERFEVVSALDPAIETERMPTHVMREYVESRDLRIVQPYLRAGSKPTVYHVREVPHELWESYVMASTGEAERYRRAFMCGIESIDELAQNDGTTLPNWEPPRDSNGVMMHKAVARVSAQEREEVGAIIWQHSFLPRRIEGCFLLPPSSLARLSARGFLPAGASRSSAESSSDEASSRPAPHQPASTPTEPTNETNGEASGSRTAATAAEMPTLAAS